MKYISIVAALLILLLNDVVAMMIPSEETLAHVHYTLYFNRIYREKVPVQKLEKNLIYSQKIIDRARAVNNINREILISKSNAEIAFIKAFLYLNKKEYNKALRCLDLSSKHLSIINIKNVESLTMYFISKSSIMHFKEFIKIMRKNIYRKIVEDAYLDTKYSKRKIKLDTVKICYNNLVADTTLDYNDSGTKTFEGRSTLTVKRIYNFIMLKNYINLNNCDSIRYFSNQLNKLSGVVYLYMVDETPIKYALEHDNDLYEADLKNIQTKRQSNIEKTFSPVSYLIAQRPSTKDIDSLIRYSLEKCSFDLDEVKADTIVYPIVAAAMRNKQMPILNSIPNTNTFVCNIQIPFRGVKRLKDIDTKLRFYLDECGYSEKSYYAYSDGFAIVTRIEQINEKCFPLNENQRWSIETNYKINTLFDYFNQLFLSNKGYFRFMIFVYNSKPIIKDNSTLFSFSKADSLFLNGADRLSETLKNQIVNSDYNLCVFVYEFIHKEFGDAPIFKLDSNHTGKQHLVNTKFANYLSLN